MSNRISQAFARAKQEGRGAFVAYLTMGYPTLAASEAAAMPMCASSSAKRLMRPKAAKAAAMNKICLVGRESAAKPAQATAAQRPSPSISTIIANPSPPAAW